MSQAEIRIVQKTIGALRNEDYAFQSTMGDRWVRRLIEKANQMGLEGKRITGLVGFSETQDGVARFLEFSSEDASAAEK